MYSHSLELKSSASRLARGWAPDYAARRSTLAKKIGLGRKAAAKPTPPPEPEKKKEKDTEKAKKEKKSQKNKDRKYK